MNSVSVCVVGLWHLGTVTAACLASIGHRVTGLDFDANIVDKLLDGQPPVIEPGLDELLLPSIKNGSLGLTSDTAVVSNAEIVWITFDTPVDEDDKANVAFVVSRVRQIFPCLREGTLVIISSQLPVGTTKLIEQEFQAAHPNTAVTFAYSPENLRLGNAIETFLHPERVVIGVRSDSDHARIMKLVGPITEHIEWMSVESAEMTKHAINAFLALSVTFANEIATLCESVGADAKEVERGLKSERRIGPKAYLSPGGPYAGGTLARDVQFLASMRDEHQRPLYLLNAIQDSNIAHMGWPRHKLLEIFGNLSGKTVAIWGLTYKPGTNTLRRSSSIELCQYLTEHGANVQVHDPAVRYLPPELSTSIILSRTALDALNSADALVLGTNWPEYQQVQPEEVLSRMNAPVILDVSRFLQMTLGSDRRIRYITIGKS